MRRVVGHGPLATAYARSALGGKNVVYVRAFARINDVFPFA